MREIKTEIYYIFNDCTLYKNNCMKFEYNFITHYAFMFSERRVYFRFTKQGRREKMAGQSVGSLAFDEFGRPFFILKVVLVED